MAGTFQNTTKLDVYLVAGIMILNVYAQVFSIFSKAGMIAFCCIAVIVLILFGWCMIELKKDGFSLQIKGIATWKICVLIVLGGALFSFAWLTESLLKVIDNSIYIFLNKRTFRQREQMYLPCSLRYRTTGK